MFDYTKEPGKKLIRRYNTDKAQSPIISIITPFYNAGKFFTQTYNCVLNQTFPYFEWVIVNDGSTNKEDVRLLEELASTDERIFVYHKENGGAAEARNFAVKHARADILLILDADDLILPTEIECLYWALLKNPQGAWSYCGLVGFGEKQHLWSIPFNSGLEKTRNILIVNCAIRKKDFNDVGGYHVAGRYYNEDWHFFLKMLAAGKKPIQLLNYYGFWYRTSSTGGLSVAINDKQVKAKNEKLIAEVAKTVPNDILPVGAIGNRKEELPTPKPSNWDKKLSYIKKKTNILMLLPWMVVGGADKFNLDIVSKSDKEKYEFSIITTLPFDAENCWEQEFREHVSDIFNLPQFLSVDDYAEFIHYFIKSRSIDILFLSCSYYGYYILPWLKKEFPQLKIVDFYHSEPMYWREGGYGRATVIMDDYIDKTYVGDDMLRTQKIAKGEKTEDKIKAIYIGVDEKEFNIDNGDKNEIKHSLQIDKNRPVVLFLARISHEKRPLLMVEIAKEVKSKIPNIAFLVVGDGDETQKVKDKCQKYGLEGTVYFAGRQKSVINCYAAADITLLCSIKEGLALTAYESLAMGKPMITADVGGQSCLIDNTVGRVVPLMQDESQVFETTYSKEEVKLYVDAICEVLKDKQLYEQMAQNCRNKILNGFTIDCMIKNLDREFDMLMQQKATSPPIQKAKPGLEEEMLTMYCAWDTGLMAQDGTVLMRGSSGAKLAQSPEWKLVNKLMHIATQTWYGKFAYKVYKKFFRK